MNSTQDPGPFFHGTKAALSRGDLLTAGFPSNYRPEILMNHIYFTALRDGAGLAAELAAGDDDPHVYVVGSSGLGLVYTEDPCAKPKSGRSYSFAPTKRFSAFAVAGTITSHATF